MTLRYEEDYIVDGGDLGAIPATITGSVIETGLFDFADGFLDVKIEKVIIYFLPEIRIDITKRLNPVAIGYMEEYIQKKYENDRGERGA